MSLARPSVLRLRSSLSASDRTSLNWSQTLNWSQLQQLRQRKQRTWRKRVGVEPTVRSLGKLLFKISNRMPKASNLESERPTRNESAFLFPFRVLRPTLHQNPHFCAL